MAEVNKIKVTHEENGWFFFSKNGSLFLIEVEKNSETCGIFDSYRFFTKKQDALDHVKSMDPNWVHPGDK